MLSPAQAEPIALANGQIEGSQSGAIRVFKGMPYAAPPVGPLRWRPPQPPKPWSGVRQATAFSPACPQLGRYPPDAPAQSTSEDCLTLNIWAPAGSKDVNKLPVMVWIHGGGLMDGSGSLPNYAGDQLAARGVVVVTINYRLGALGFLAHPELNKESQHGGSGNYGLLDQIAALKWVNRNIAQFGGDPSRVTVFGQSSGSFSISMLVSSPLAKGLFHRAIGQSGGVFEPVELDPRFTPEGAAEAGLRFAKRAGAQSLAELRAMPVTTLLKAKFNPQFNIDGHVLPASPYDTYAAGKQNDVDLLVGTNAEEATSFFDASALTAGNFDAVMGRTYPRLLLWAIGSSPGKSNADAQRAAVAIDTDMRFRWGMWAWANHVIESGGRKTFFYRFTHRAPYRVGHPYYGLQATHGAELPFVFGDMNPDAAKWSPRDKQLAASIQLYWTNFAKTGDPNGAGLPRWPSFDRDKGKVMGLGLPLRVAPTLDRDRLRHIDNVYATARLGNKYLYGIIALALGMVLLFLTYIFRAVKRLFDRSRRSGSPSMLESEG